MLLEAAALVLALTKAPDMIAQPQPKPIEIILASIKPKSTSNKVPTGGGKTKNKPGSEKHTRPKCGPPGPGCVLRPTNR